MDPICESVLVSVVDVEGAAGSYINHKYIIEHTEKLNKSQK